MSADRWKELADKWEPSAEDTHYAFNDMHAMMTFAGDGRDTEAATLLAAAASYVTERGKTNQPHDQGGRHAHLPGDPGLQPRRL